MSDPQHPQVPPYVLQQPAFPDQPHYPAQPPAGAQQAGHPRQTAQGYVLNGQSLQPGQPAYAGASRAAVNPAGRAGLILGLIAIAISLVGSIAIQVLLRSNAYGGYALYNVVSGIGSLIAFAAALAALILGLIGIRRAGAPHAAAGIAVGIGIAQVASIAFGFLSSTIGAFLYF
jgi:hypothetical protein